jgi:hypothetical protein
MGTKIKDAPSGTPAQAGDAVPVDRGGTKRFVELDSAASQPSSAFAAAGALATHIALTTGAHGMSAYGASLVAVADSSAARTALGLGSAAVAASGDFQAADAELAAIAGLTSAADKGIQFTGIGTAGLFDLTAAGKALLDDATASDQRTTLGLGTLATQSGTFSGTTSGTNTGDQTITLTGDVTGSGVGSFAATIAAGAVSYAKIQNVSATDKLLGRSSALAGVIEEIACTAFARSILDDAAASDVRTTLGLGTAALSATGDFQAADAELAAIAGLTSAADKLPYFTGSGTASLADLSVFARTILDDADAATVRATIGAGTGSGDALTSGKLSQFAATTSAELAGVISDETGSGVLVFGTSPVIATPTISASASAAGVTLARTATASAQGASSIAGTAVTVNASNAVAGSSNAGAAAGGSVTITAGNAARLTSGNANGGDINLTPGAGIGTGVAGKVLVPSGKMVFWSGLGGFYADSSDTIGMVNSNGSYGGTFTATDIAENAGGAPLWRVSRNFGVELSSANIFGWSNSSASITTKDTGLARDSANTVRITAGLSGLGKLLHGVVVTAKTGDYTVTANESNTHFTNAAAGGAIALTMPTMVAGYTYEFSVQAAQYLKVLMNTGDIVRTAAGDSAAAGYIRSNVVGSSIRGVAVDATYLQIVSTTGTWTVDS